MSATPIKGRVTDLYTSRSGETVYVIAWDDRATRPLQDVVTPAALRIGQRVELEGNVLIGLGEKASTR